MVSSLSVGVRCSRKRLAVDNFLRLCYVLRTKMPRRHIVNRKRVEKFHCQIGGKSRIIRGANRIRAVLAKARPTGYLAAVTEAKELVSLTKQEIIARITPLLNAQVSAMPSENYGDKQKIASWVNGELRQLGLAIRCPKTNHPAILVADVRGGEHEISRFRLEIRDDSGNRKRTWSSHSITELTLMEDSPREEPIAKWSARLRQKRQDNQRE